MKKSLATLSETVEIHCLLEPNLSQRHLREPQGHLREPHEAMGLKRSGNSQSDGASTNQIRLYLLRRTGNSQSDGASTNCICLYLSIILIGAMEAEVGACKGSGILNRLALVGT